MRVHKKNSPHLLKNSNIYTLYGEIDYKALYESIKNYLVFKISVTTGLNERLGYLDVLNHMERLQQEANNLRGE